MAEQWLVIGVDDSPRAASVARIGLAVARRAGRKPVLVHALGGRKGKELIGSRRLDMRDDGQAMLERVAGQVGEPELGGVVVFGEPLAELATVTDDLGADLLVVGSREHHRRRGALAGSLARRLLRAAPCPVVVVPEAVPERWHLGSRIICGGLGERDPVVGFARRLASDLDSQLSVVEAQDDFDGLEQAAHEQGAGLLVVGSPGSGWLKRRLLGANVCEELAATSSLPVVVVPDDLRSQRAAA